MSAVHQHLKTWDFSSSSSLLRALFWVIPFATQFLYYVLVAKHCIAWSDVLFLIFCASSLWVSGTRKRGRSKYLKNKNPDQTRRLQSAAKLYWLSNAERMTQNGALNNELGSGIWLGKVLSCCSARCGIKYLENKTPDHTMRLQSTETLY